MTIDTQTAVAVAVPVIAGLAWLLRLEGRINLNERLTNGLIEDVQYIRRRIDEALNGHD